ncbi:Uma2 family endonuclease [Streptomyces acidiscabies]|uniref:Uma2 family endonuclease n=1 Tax=Streptomyces acidiscabies TaxID=42234 RepID=UPI000D1A6540|nr:Uma2 family endonuclease [Streptomyces acidiscabies]
MAHALGRSAPGGCQVVGEMTVRLDRRSRFEPNVLVATAAYDPDRTWYAPEDVVLVVEVVSEESAARDRLKTAAPFPLDLDLTSLVP